MCLLNLWGRLSRNRRTRKKCFEMSLGLFLAVLWVLGTSAVVGLLLIYSEFRSEIDKQNGGDGDDDQCVPVDCLPPIFALCDEILNGTSFNVSQIPPPNGPPIVLCEGPPSPLVVHLFGGDVQNTTKAISTWIRIRSTVVINAMVEFIASFDAAGSSSGYITLRTPMPVTSVQHRGGGTVEVTSGSSFWLCPAQVISEGGFMAVTYSCGSTGILSQSKVATVSYTLMVQAQ